MYERQQAAQTEGKTHDELAEMLCEIVQAAPRDVALEWLNRCLLPMLEENRRKLEGKGA